MGTAEAMVDVLTAEVRALMIGSRQVTLSVYRQLDTVDDGDCDPFGRVRDGKDPGSGVYVVGRNRTTGALIRSHRRSPLDVDAWNVPRLSWGEHDRNCHSHSTHLDYHPCRQRWCPETFGRNWCVAGPSRDSWRMCGPGNRWEPWDGAGWIEVNEDGDQWAHGPWVFSSSDPPPPLAEATTLAESGAYQINVELPHRVAVTDDIAPGRWEFTTPEAEIMMTEWATKGVQAADQIQREYEEWMALPLIVLAGLR